MRFKDSVIQRLAIQRLAIQRLAIQRLAASKRLQSGLYSFTRRSLAVHGDAMSRCFFGRKLISI
jgi:hypothetical protein